MHFNNAFQCHEKNTLIHHCDIIEQEARSLCLYKLER